MLKLKAFWVSLFDVRKGEMGRTVWMTLYLMLVLFAYYILKPVSRAIFLSSFDIDKLPWLYVLIASIGGVLAYLYTKLAVHTSLRRAVDTATVFSVAVLVAFWWLLPYKWTWVIYGFNIWVSLFSIILVSQGWLVAANIFTSREAKRLYGILGVGSVIGAAFGGSFTAFMVRIIGTTNLLLASAAMVVLSYGAFWGVLLQKGVSLKDAKAAEEDEEFTFREVVRTIRGNRHLQVIIAIISITFIVDVLVEFQFSFMAKERYHRKDDLTAFLGNFYGFWLNLVTFVLQLFLTSFVVTRFGVGGTLQIMPVSILLASVATLVAPGVVSTAAARLTEASTRYSFNKTGMELLYLPLPLELRNRTKAFVDVFVDRLARGMGGMILVFFTTVVILKFRHFSLVVMAFGALWIFLSVLAKREYVATVRRRLESRRLDLESARVSVDDPGMIRLLEETALGEHARQASYALSLLAETPHYRLDPLLAKLAAARAPEVRAKVFELAAARSGPALLADTQREIREAEAGKMSPAVQPAVRYLLTHSEDQRDSAARLLEHPNQEVREAAADWLADRPEIGRELITPDWLSGLVQDGRVERRALAALAARAAGESARITLLSLLEDRSPEVVQKAMRSAAVVQEREFVPVLVRNLANPKLRGAGIEALAAYGPRISGTLSDLLEDRSAAVVVRRQIPRVLRLIRDQRSVDVLLRSLAEPNLAVRSAILRALNRLRESAPDLDYGAQPVREQFLNEARYYFEMHAALAAFEEQRKPQTAAGLLAATLEDRLKDTLERLFRLLGLRYPPRQIYAAYLALSRNRTDDHAAALEFLDSVVERELKRVLLPLLDDPARLSQSGRELFGVETKTPEEALRSLMQSGDEWLVSCAIAAAAELGARELAPEIERVSSQAGADVCKVARSAVAVLS